MVKLLDEFYLYVQCVLRCLRLLNTHISSSNISVQTLPKEGEKHHFFKRGIIRKIQLLDYLKRTLQKKNLTRAVQDDRMHLYTPDIEAAAHQSCFPILRKQMIFLSFGLILIIEEHK